MSGLQDEGGNGNRQRLGRFGDQGIDAEECPLPAHTGAQLVLICHLGEQDVRQGLRSGKPETDQQEAERDERVGDEGYRNQAHTGDHQQQLLSLHQAHLFADEVGNWHTADQWNEDKRQQDDRVHFKHVIGQVEDRPGHQRGNQDGHEILGSQDEEAFAGEGKFYLVYEFEGFIQLGELRAFLDLEGGGNDQYHAGHADHHHGNLQREERWYCPGLWAEQVWDDKTQQRTQQAKQRGRNLQVVTLGVRFGYFRQQGGIHQPDDGVAAIIQHHADQHPHEQCEISGMLWRQPDQDEGRREKRGGVTHVRDAAAVFGAGAVRDIAKDG